jgi:hypothetical protein
LKSKIPSERTLGARLLVYRDNLFPIDYLIAALKVETKLYTKIELCNSLVSFGKDVIISLIESLGKIGNNQYKEVPEAEFKKQNYPLPRDIASRTIIRIGVKAIPALIKVLDSEDIPRLSEALDALGFICFYEQQSDVYDLLKECFSRNIDNDLIKWKIFRAMSAFAESELFLNEQQQLLSNERMKAEIERSLSLIRKRG